MKQKGINLVIQLIETLAGSFIIAVAVSLFLLPNELSLGGFSGIATIAYYILKIPMGTTILVLNIPLFILAAFKIGKTFLQDIGLPIWGSYNWFRYSFDFKSKFLNWRF